MTKKKLEQLMDAAHRNGWNAAIHHSIRVVQSWEPRESQITDQLLADISRRSAKGKKK